MKFRAYTFLFGIVAVLMVGQASAKVYRPGLVQGVYQGKATMFQNTNNAPYLPTNLLTQTTYANYQPVEYAYGTFMADNGAANNSVKFTNPYTGTEWNWPTEYSVFAYEGEIYLHAGDQMVASGRLDDGSAVLVGGEDGVWLFKMGTTSGYNGGPSQHNTYTATADGWVKINAWAWDWSGGKNICGGYISGIQYNLSGTLNNWSEATIWSRLKDPGDGSFLRFAKEESFMQVGMLDVDGDDVLATVAFTGVPVAAELRAYTADADAGEDPAAWTAVSKVADIAAGDTASAVYRISGAKNAGVVRLCLINPPVSPASNEVLCTAFYEFSSPLQLGDTSPSASIVSVEPHYTDLSAQVSVDGFGLGAALADVFLEASLVESFDTIAVSRPIGEGVQATGTLSADLTGLTTNTVYYLRARIVNEKNVAAYSETVSVTTLEPTVATGAFELSAMTSDSFSFLAKVEAFGLDSTAATMRMECSTSEDFEELIASETVSVADSASLGQQSLLTIYGLDSGTSYLARLKIVNSWGLVTYTTSQTFTTIQPVVIQGVGYASTSAGFTAMVALQSVEVAAVTVELFADGVSCGTHEATAAGIVSFDVPTTKSSVNLRAVVSFGSSSVSAETVATQGTGVVMQPTPLACNTAATAIVLSIGDTVVLPVPVGNASYVSLGEQRYLKGDGNRFTAMDAGITSIDCYDAAGNLAGNAFVLVLPPMQEGGRAFVFDLDNNTRWDAEAGWTRIYGSEGTIPNGPKDVAFVVFTKNRDFCLCGERTLQELFIGCPVDTATTHRFYGDAGSSPCLNLAGIPSRKNPRPGKVTFCASTTNDRRQTVYFCSYNEIEKFTVPVGENGLAFDLGGPTDPSYPNRNLRTNFTRLIIDRYVSIDVPAGREFSLVNGSDRTGGLGDGQGLSDCYFQLTASGLFSGSGLVRFATPGVLTIGQDIFANFQGEIVNSMRNFVTTYNSSRGGPFWSCDGNINVGEGATMTIEGYVSQSDNYSIRSGVGAFSQGNSHGYGSPSSQTGNGIPSAGLTLNGGFFSLIGYSKTKTEFHATVLDGVEDYEAQNKVDVLNLKGGLSILANESGVTTVGNPFMHFEADSIVRSDDATLLVLDSMTYFNNELTRRARTDLKGLDAYAVGNTDTTDFANDVFPVVPWCISRINNSVMNGWWWGYVDENGTMRRASSRSNVTLADLTTETAANRNVFSDGRDMGLADDLTVNSLTINNFNKNKRLGEHTLTVRSGALLMLENNSALGEQGYGDQNGTVVFPERAYVWAAASSTADKIFSRIVAPKGLVAAFAGRLQLAGDQTGIDSDIVVNGGTLELGSTDGTVGCSLDVPITLVGGNAKLQVNASGALDKLDLNLKSVAGYGPKLILPDGAEESCSMLHVDGVAMSAGTYGATGSGAEFIDDMMFSGTGVLRVRKDDKAGFIIYVR